MSNQVNVQSLKCPECSGPIKVTNASCPHCCVGLLINYAEILGVQNYDMNGRNAVLDAALLALVEQEAKKHGVEVVPVASKDSIVIYVRHAETKKLVSNCIMESIPVNNVYILMGKESYWQILTQTKLDGGEVYLLGRAHNMGYYRLAEGEAELGNIPEIQEWVKDSIAAAFPQIELNPASERGIPWKLFDFLKS